MATGILVLAEQLRGGLADITFEMLGVGRQLADAMHGRLEVVLVGGGMAPLAARLGVADTVLVAEQPGMDVVSAETAVALLAKLVAERSAGLVLIPGTNLAMGIGALLAARTDLPFVNFCHGLKAEDGAVVATSQLFGGKMLSEVRLADGRGIVSVYPGAFPAEPGRSDRAPAVEPIELPAVPAAASAVTFRRFIEPEAGDVDITKEQVLVGVGRGIQTQDNLALAEELAAALGGTVCGSRPVIDQGWLPLTRQVGKSGMTVKPRLYIALGMSGAPEHVEGMRGAQLIVAVNTDAAAPIFDIAHYGVCADLLEVLPVLTEKIAARRG